MCRSCCFSPAKDNAIYTVQSGSRGHAHVIEWKYKLGPGAGGRGGIKCSVEPTKTVDVSRFPVTSLCVRSDGARLAVGNVEGSVLVYRLPGFAKVRAAFLVVWSLVDGAEVLEWQEIGISKCGGGVVVGWLVARRLSWGFWRGRGLVCELLFPFLASFWRVWASRAFTAVAAV